MIYALIPASIAAMLGYMLWSASFRLRPDRVRAERDRKRGKFAFRPKERIRFLLNRSFSVPDEKIEWEDALVSRLAQTPARTRQRSN